MENLLTEWQPLFLSDVAAARFTVDDNLPENVIATDSSINTKYLRTVAQILSELLQVDPTVFWSCLLRDKGLQTFISSFLTNYRRTRLLREIEKIEDDSIRFSAVSNIALHDEVLTTVCRYVLLMMHRALQTTIPTMEHTKCLNNSIFIGSGGTPAAVECIVDLFSILIGSPMADLIIDIIKFSMRKIPALRKDTLVWCTSVLTSSFDSFQYRYGECLPSLYYQHLSSKLEDFGNSFATFDSLETYLLRLLDILGAASEAAATLVGLLITLSDLKDLSWITSSCNSDKLSDESSSGFAEWANILHSLAAGTSAHLNTNTSASFPSNLTTTSSSSSSSSVLSLSIYPQEQQVYRLFEACQKSFLHCILNPLFLNVVPLKVRFLYSTVKLAEQRCRRLLLQALCLFAILPAYTESSEFFESLTEWAVALVERAAEETSPVGLSSTDQQLVKKMINEKGLGLNITQNVADPAPKVCLEVGKEKSQQQPAAQIIASDFHLLGISDTLRKWHGWIHQTQIDFLSALLCPEEYQYPSASLLNATAAPPFSLALSQRLPEESTIGLEPQEFTNVESLGISDSELSAVQSIQEVLNDFNFGDGFILVLYKQMNCSVERVIDAVLSDTLPPVTQLDRKLGLSDGVLSIKRESVASQSKHANVEKGNCTSLLNFDYRAKQMQNGNNRLLEPDPTMKSKVMELVTKQQVEAIRDAMRDGHVIDADASLTELIPGLRNDDLDLIEISDDEAFERRYKKMMWDPVNAANKSGVNEDNGDEYDDTLDQYGSLVVPAGDEEEINEEQTANERWGRNRVKGGRWEEAARDVVGRDDQESTKPSDRRGRWKEKNKAQVANHNRRDQRDRKMNRTITPFQT